MTIGLFSDVGRNQALDALGGYVWLSLHDAYSPIGEHEFLTLEYVRQPTVYLPADGGIKQSAAVTFPRPVGSVGWVGAWDAEVGGNFLGMAPNGSTTPGLFWCADTVTGVFHSPGHTLVDNNRVFLLTGRYPVTVLPAGLAAWWSYYVVNAVSDTFQLSEFLGGDAIIPSTSGMGFFQQFVVTVLDGSADLVVTAFTLDATLF
jgi:hypothetical protein